MSASTARNRSAWEAITDLMDAIATTYVLAADRGWVSVCFWCVPSSVYRPYLVFIGPAACIQAIARQKVPSSAFLAYVRSPS